MTQSKALLKAPVPVDDCTSNNAKSKKKQRKKDKRKDSKTKSKTEAGGGDSVGDDSGDHDSDGDGDGDVEMVTIDGIGLAKEEEPEYVERELNEFVLL